MEWNDDMEAAPRGELVLGFVVPGEWPVVGKVIFPKSKRPTRKNWSMYHSENQYFTYNFKANDGRGTEYVALYWMPLPPPPKGICY